MRLRILVSFKGRCPLMRIRTLASNDALSPASSLSIDSSTPSAVKSSPLITSDNCHPGWYKQHGLVLPEIKPRSPRHCRYVYSQIIPASRVPYTHFVCWLIIFPNPSSCGGAMKMLCGGTPFKCAFLMTTHNSDNGLPFCVRWAAYLENSAFLLSSGGVLA